MSNYRKKSHIVQAVTFEELEAEAAGHANPNDFTFHGWNVKRTNEDTFIVDMPNVSYQPFTRGNFLLIHENDDLYPCTPEFLEDNYDIME